MANLDRLLRATALSVMLSFSPSSMAEVKTVAIMKTLSNPSMDARSSAFRNTLIDIYDGSGDALNIIEFDIENSADIGAKFLDEVVLNRKVDLLVPIATSATAVAWSRREELKASGIESLFFFVSDPVGMGIVDDIGAVSGYPFSGFVNVMDRGVKLDLVLSMLNQESSATKRILLVHSSYPASVYDAQLLLEESSKRDSLEFIPIQLTFDHAKTPDEYIAELEAKLAAINRQFDYIWVGLGPLGRNTEYLSKILAHFRQPIVCSSNEESVRQGALFTVTSNAKIDGTAAAGMAEQVLSGLSTSSIPVERTPKFLVAVNVSTAEKMGIRVPINILKLADGRVYK